VLQAEGISVVGMIENTNVTACRQVYETLLCWVLVDPFQKHGFCRLEHAFLEQNSYSCFNYRYEIHVSLILSFWFNVLGHLSVLLSLQ